MKKQKKIKWVSLSLLFVQLLHSSHLSQFLGRFDSLRTGNHEWTNVDLQIVDNFNEKSLLQDRPKMAFAQISSKFWTELNVCSHSRIIDEIMSRLSFVTEGNIYVPCIIRSLNSQQC